MTLGDARGVGNPLQKTISKAIRQKKVPRQSKRGKKGRRGGTEQTITLDEVHGGGAENSVEFSNPMLEVAATGDGADQAGAKEAVL